MGGVNLVAGFRPELWAAVVPDDLPRGLAGFNEDLVGVDGFVVPATQRGRLADSTIAQRSHRDPCLEMWPRWVCSALERSVGVRPAHEHS
jgi:hypothetical protein